MASRSTLQFLAAVLLILSITSHAVEAKGTRYRHYFFYKNAPKTASDVRVALFKAYNGLKTTPASGKVLYWTQGFADTKNKDDPVKYPWNWGGYYEFANRAAWEKYDAWQKTQQTYASTFAPLTDATRFHTTVNA